jgi:hypothetical protein
MHVALLPGHATLASNQSYYPAGGIGNASGYTTGATHVL